MRKYVPNESPEVLIGREPISRYLGVCTATVDRWRKHGLPIASLPDGRLATTKVLINQWLMARIGLKGDLQHRMKHARKYTEQYREYEQPQSS